MTESIPMAHVSDVDRSAAFYELLGFVCHSRFAGPDGGTNWCLLSSGDARLMLARASGRINAAEQAVLFYMYSGNVVGLREHLLWSGVPDGGVPDFEGKPVNFPAHAPCVFQVVTRFFMPAGELRIHDPDGYVVLVGQRD
ncbi:MAG: hypothetical protein ACK58L_12940 [Planctomycetota bacterium]